MLREIVFCEPSCCQTVEPEPTWYGTVTHHERSYGTVCCCATMPCSDGRPALEASRVWVLEPEEEVQDVEVKAPPVYAAE